MNIQQAKERVKAAASESGRLVDTADLTALLEHLERVEGALKVLADECWAEFSTDGIWASEGQLVSHKAYITAVQAMAHPHDQ